MAIPTVFAPVLPQDFTLVPIQVHKNFAIDSASYATTASGYKYWEAIYTSEDLKLDAPNAPTYPTNSIDGTYKHVVWKSIDTQYYRFPYDRVATKEHANPRYTYKHLGISASILSIPYHDVGERIKPRSVQITGSGASFYLQDDGNGNLYDTSIVTGSFPTNHNLVAYWSFKDEFRRGTLNTLNTTYITRDGEVEFKSKTFTPDSPSKAKNIAAVHYSPAGLKSGSSVYFSATENAYIRTDHRDDFNFTSNDDFTIAFWGLITGSQGDYTSSYLPMITKKGVKNAVKYGDKKIVKDTVTIQAKKQFTASIENDATDVYPFDFSFVPSGSNSGKVAFRRSDGIYSLELSSSAITDSWHHYCVTRTGSTCILYVDGEVVVSGSDPTINPVNFHDVMFGAGEFNTVADYARWFMAEPRFYNKAFSKAEIATLSTGSSVSFSQTAVVGNVFYRTGNIVLTSDFAQYRNAFINPDRIRWQSTHTIYQYECLVRVKKGDFNLTHNPTARQSYKSDLLVNDFTGSLYPYATTIGLYNQAGELMAVAKLAQPIQMRDDVDISFLIRWDV